MTKEEVAKRISLSNGDGLCFISQKRVTGELDKDYFWVSHNGTNVLVSAKYF